MAKQSRRKFIVRSILGGTGLLVGATYVFNGCIRRGLAGMVNTTESPYAGNTSDPEVWFEISAYNQVTLYSPKVEMGQGTFTGMAQLAAEELEINISQIQVKHAPSSMQVDKFATGGSTSISSLWVPLRELAATTREIIKAEAANKMGVALASLKVTDGVISSGAKTMTYGEAVKGITKWEIGDKPALKSLKEYKYIGKPVSRVDLKDKVLGKPMYGMDAAMPDMLFGAVVRPSAIGAKYISADTTAAEKMPGVVKVVKEKDFVGVVATSRMEAENAKEAIKVTWKTEKKWQTKDITDMIKVGQGKAYVIQKEGKPKSSLEEEDGLITAEFTSPLGAHAQIEPNGAVAYVEKDNATLMLSTQVVDITRKEVAKRLGFDKEQVEIIPTFLGGGFGRRLHTPNAIQAAVLSKAVGKPVKCFFNRKEEFQNDTFRPPTHHVLKGKLDAKGNIEALEHNVSSGDVAYGSAIVPHIANLALGADLGAWRGGMIQYGAIPNYQAISWRVKLPFATSWWRSLGLLANTFAIESFMDELAVKAGKNPLDFRLAHIQDDTAGFRLKEVLKAAAAKANYKDEVVDGVAMGLACSTDVNTPVAQIAEVSIVDGEIKVHKVTCVIDPGLAVNPDQIRAQCEGAIIMGMSAAMFEKMEVVDGQLDPIIYGPYQMAMMRHAPKDIDVVILENGESPGAVGEPPLGPIGAAIANAVFRLTGERVRDMPFGVG
ncbi:molybdopterin cofactor-binding domain-containing protein [uncultured Arcticibacterium sp.]|uniref:xanthine dehydrogenase family protein molybdopterin-binding subunit n=1 Tax=uncultured Arcticibacterium sp. TaxID=2173042 RepID=UPI0030F7F71F